MGAEWVHLLWAVVLLPRGEVWAGRGRGADGGGLHVGRSAGGRVSSGVTSPTSASVACRALDVVGVRTHLRWLGGMKDMGPSWPTA